MGQHLDLNMLRVRGAYKILSFLFINKKGATIQDIAGVARLRPNTVKAYLNAYNRGFNLGASAVAVIIYSLRPDYNYKDHPPFVEREGHLWKLTQEGVELLDSLHKRA